MLLRLGFALLAIALVSANEVRGRRQSSCGCQAIVANDQCQCQPTTPSCKCQQVTAIATTAAPCACQPVMQTTPVELFSYIPYYYLLQAPVSCQSCQSQCVSSCLTVLQYQQCEPQCQQTCAPVCQVKVRIDQSTQCMPQCENACQSQCTAAGQQYQQCQPACQQSCTSTCQPTVTSCQQATQISYLTVTQQQQPAQQSCQCQQGYAPCNQGTQCCRRR
ncbi:unnamed protein product, partial [Mesorhabditis spiculigera]